MTASRGVLYRLYRRYVFDPLRWNWWTRARCLRREARDLYSEGPDGSRPRIDPRKQQRVVVLRHHVAMTGETPLEARCTSGVGNPAVGTAVRVGDGRERTTCRVFELGPTIDERRTQLSIVQRGQTVVAKRVKTDLVSAIGKQPHLFGS